jgi:hypothetical protein
MAPFAAIIESSHRGNITDRMLAPASGRGQPRNVPIQYIWSQLGFARTGAGILASARILVRKFPRWEHYFSFAGTGPIPDHAGANTASK